MSAMRFLLDENVDPLYRSELLRCEPSLVVWRVGDISAPPASTLDPAILVWCEQNAFLLVTNNRKSMPAHLGDHLGQGRHAPGIIVLNDKMGIGETIEELWLMWAASREDEYRDSIMYLPLR